MILIAIIEIMFSLFLSVNIYSLTTYNNGILNQQLNSYNKEQIIYYTKTFGPGNGKYCLDFKTFNFISNCSFELFKTNKKYLTYVNTNNNLLYYRNIKNKGEILKSTLK